MARLARPIETTTRSTSDSILLHSSRTSRKRVAVQFGLIEIHEFAAAIGHNPSVTAGVPITLSELPIRSTHFDLLDYEHQRQGQRRRSRQLHLPKELREEMLLAQGFAKSEIIQAIRAARVIRAHRKQSNDSRAITEAVEEASRKLKQLMKGAKHSPLSQVPAHFKIGAINTDLRGRSNYLTGATSCDKTLATFSTIFSDEVPKLPQRDFSPEQELKPITRKASYDRLPNMPLRFPLSEVVDSTSSEAGVSTTLRGALTLSSQEISPGQSMMHGAPKLPARRVSDKDDPFLTDVCQLVEALDVVDAMLRNQEKCSLAHLTPPLQLSPSSNNSILPQALSRSIANHSGDNGDAEEESTFWHSYSNEQAPRAPCRAKLRTKSPVAA